MAAHTKSILTGNSSQPVSVGIIEGLSNWRLGIMFDEGIVFMGNELIRETILTRVADAFERLRFQGVLNVDVPDGIAVERPSNADNGDFSTSLALRLARPARRNPLEIAQALAEQVELGDELAEVWAAPPGFVNFRLSDAWLAQQVEAVRHAGDDYGSVNLGSGQPVMVEFVSVNPTGPVHVGHTRGAVLGSALAKVLQAAGYDVTREYYVNDAGSQMEAFYASLLARYRQALGVEAELPEGGYQGEYVADLARELVEQEGDRYLQLSTDGALGEIAPLGRQKMVDLIRDDLEQIGVEFDNWFSEGSLYRGDEYESAMGLLRSRGYVSKEDGAVWFASKALGQDKDNVLVRSNGSPTYFASDVAYHYNKFARRGFQQVIDIWGADHQGHVPRMKAAMEAMDIDPDRLTIMISQMVTLKRGDETVRASKRTGQFITLRELVEEVGSDACRYNFLARTPSTQMDFDMELAKKEGLDNPVYYLQYGYSRIASILNNAQERGIDWSGGDVSLLQHSAEMGLIRKLLVLPELVESMARTLEPHHLPHYTLELAMAFHSFYENCRVLSSEPADHEMMLARLKLTEAARVVMARCLGLMGMSAPERM